jgi:hypothetical protein
MFPYDAVRQAKTLHKTMLLSTPNVVGVGIGYKLRAGQATTEPSVIVLVRQKTPLAGLRSEAVIPHELSGIRTDVIEVGDLRPLQTRTERWRPAPGGVSLGHYKISAGTLGSLVYDQRSGEPLILSNNHVLANNNQAVPGDPILQPGPADGGLLQRDTIARLLRFVPLRFNVAPATCSFARSYARLGNALAGLLGSAHRIQVIRNNPSLENRVDAAVARPVDDRALEAQTLEIGKLTGSAQAEPGQAVRKSGRTTSLTYGEVTVIDTTITVGYTPYHAATFENQILTTPMSEGGDSGSLLALAGQPLAVGLLFAGSAQTTIFNPIQAVMQTLEIEIGNAKEEANALRQDELRRAQAVRQAYQETLLAKTNVTGVGIGLRHTAGKRTGQLGLVVTVAKKVPQAWLNPQDVLPKEIDGVPVDVRETGKLEAY